MSIAVYRSTLRRTEEPRAIERRLMTRLNGALAAHAPVYDGAARGPQRLGILASGLADALRENATVWRALGRDLADEGNGLPAEMRAGLMSIAGWVERETQRLLGGAGRVAPLIEVNAAIIAGLAADRPPVPPPPG